MRPLDTGVNFENADLAFQVFLRSKIGLYARAGITWSEKCLKNGAAVGQGVVVKCQNENEKIWVTADHVPKFSKQKRLAGRKWSVSS